MRGRCGTTRHYRYERQDEVRPMTMTPFRAFALSLVAASIAWPIIAAGQGGNTSSPAPRASYVRIGARGDASDAVLYEPGTGAPKNGIALMFAHPSESNFNHASGR